MENKEKLGKRPVWFKITNWIIEIWFEKYNISQFFNIFNKLYLIIILLYSLDCHSELKMCLRIIRNDYWLTSLLFLLRIGCLLSFFLPLESAQSASFVYFVDTSLPIPCFLIPLFQLNLPHIEHVEGIKYWNQDCWGKHNLYESISTWFEKVE